LSYTVNQRWACAVSNNRPFKFGQAAEESTWLGQVPLSSPKVILFFPLDKATAAFCLFYWAFSSLTDLKLKIQFIKMRFLTLR
jgi:hypothetical protein